APQMSRALERATAVSTATRVVFEWALNEPDLRVRGRGVARLEGDRARLDLFTGNGETILSAALVQDELRLPERFRSATVPPPPLFWAAMGVFRPGRGAVLRGGEWSEGSDVHLLYSLPGTREIRYRL